MAEGEGNLRAGVCDRRKWEWELGKGKCRNGWEEIGREEWFGRGWELLLIKRNTMRLLIKNAELNDGKEKKDEERKRCGDRQLRRRGKKVNGVFVQAQA